jgi:sporulation delaying protein A
VIKVMVDGSGFVGSGPARTDETTTQGASAAAPARFGAAVVVVVGACALAAVLLILAYMPPNPVSLDLSPAAQLSIHQVAPQGWGFFTRDPRDKMFDLYRYEKGAWASSFLGPQSEPHNLWGISRLPRGQAIDLGTVSQNLPKTVIAKCEGAWRDCLSSLPTPSVVHNTAPRPLLCGRYLVIYRHPVPWSWSRFRHVTMPSEIINLDVRCP